MYYIYGIVDPTENMVGYVGITSNTPQQRLVQHLRQDDRDHKGAKRRWLDGLLENGYMPTVITLQTVGTIQQAQIAEKWWIAHGQMIGWPLRNYSHLVRQVEIPDTVDADDGVDEIALMPKSRIVRSNTCVLPTPNGITVAPARSSERWSVKPPAHI